MLGINVQLQRYGFVALLAAALFGISTPIAKVLLGSGSPWMTAGLLYLGSGLGLSLWWWRKHYHQNDEPLIHRSDWLWLIAAVACGGAIAPVLLLTGLQLSAASDAALLLNIEGVLTTLIAVLFFREAVTQRIWLSVVLTLIAGGVLVWRSGDWSWPALFVIAACFFWALDNNLTRKISNNDAVLIALIKGLVAGVVNVSLALLSGAQWPNLWAVSATLLLGFFSYGISLVLFVVALRHLGSARTAAHFSTAPFFGATLAIILLAEPISVAFALAFTLMVFATWLVLSEQHDHEHTHEPLQHRHLHVHDEHHQHQHDGSEGPEPHDHEHAHQPITHRHSHLPDIHHRHQH